MYYAPEEKVIILRRNLLENEPISLALPRVRLAVDGLLPLAERVPRERRGHLRAKSAASQGNGGQQLTCERLRISFMCCFACSSRSDAIAAA